MHTFDDVLSSQQARFSGFELAAFHLTLGGDAGTCGAPRVCIETARTEHQHRSANRLLRQRYVWRGYRPVSLPSLPACAALLEHLPLTATRDGAVIGTLTVGFDRPGGLNCERSFAQEVRALRAAGQRLCEFTRLAVQTGGGSIQVLAALFHVAFLATRKLHQTDTVLLEVNPRHVRFYQQMLGAKVVGQERSNRQVDAPAVLLAMTSEHIRCQIDAASTQRQPSLSSRSLYTRSFNPAEESAIVARLTSQLAAAPPQAKPQPFAFRLPTSISKHFSSEVPAA